MAIGLLHLHAPPAWADIITGELLPSVESVDVTSGPATVVFSIHIKDTTGEPISPGTLEWFGVGDTRGTEVMRLASGTTTDGTWTASVTIPKGAAAWWQFRLMLPNWTYAGAAVSATSGTGYPATGVFGDHTGDKYADVYFNSGGTLTLWPVTPKGVEGAAMTNFGSGFHRWTFMAQIGDWNSDHRSDVLVRKNDETLWIYTSTPTGSLIPWKQVGRYWGGMDKIVYAGQLTGTTTRYVVARQTDTGDLYRYELTTNGLTSITKIGQHWGGMKFFFSVGDFNGDGRGDIIGIRHNDGTMWLYPGRKDGKLDYGRQVGRGWGNFHHAFSPGDFSGDGRFDLLGVDNNNTTWGYFNNGKGGWTTYRKMLNGYWGGPTPAGLLA